MQLSDHDRNFLNLTKKKFEPQNNRQIRKQNNTNDFN